MPGRQFSGPLLPGTKSVRVYETKKARAARLKKQKYKSRSYKSRSSYKPTQSFERQMNKYNNINCEKKIMLMKNYLNGPASAGYLQDIPCVGLNNAGLINEALTCVVLQTGRQETTENATLPGGVVNLMGGYSNLTGTLPGRMIGQYAKLTSTYLNVNITMDPIDYNNDISDSISNALPHQFRFIQVKARRNKMVNPGLAVANVGTPNLGTNLFRNEEGNARGINSEVATQDIFTWFINKQFWIVVKDERFTLAPTLLTRTTDNPIAFNTNGKNYPSSRFKKYWLPKPKTKVIFRANTVDGVTENEVVDYDYVTHTIILCKNTSSGERPSNHWSVQANGATAFIDE